MIRYRFGLYILFAVLVVGDSIIIGTLLGSSREPLAAVVQPSVPLHPAILGDVSAPVTIRGEAADISKAAVIPVPTKGLDLRQVGAKSFLVYDADSRIVLAERSSREKLAVASLTKLMTALVVYNTLRFDNIVTIGQADQIGETPVLGVRSGDQINVGDLFNAMLVGSANDAALTLSHAVEQAQGTAFPILMNNTARQLGMFESNFSNPLGFDSQSNFSSAHDIALLVDATHVYTAFQLLGRSPNYSFTSLVGNYYSVQATNKLIATDPELTAIKTGYTLEALGAMVTAATHEGHSIIIIVLGSADREHDTSTLKRQVFDSYHWQGQ